MPTRTRGLNYPEFPDSCRDDADVLYHVYPRYGRAHVCSGFRCWCEPERDEQDSRVVIHHPEQ